MRARSTLRGRRLEKSRACDARFEQVRQLLGAGRYQPGERLARHVMHACARRREWTLATRVALLLGGSLRRRGRCAAAFTIVGVARPWATASRDLALLRELALLHAELCVDHARLADAEAVLEPLLTSAISDGIDTTDLLLALVRCLCWQGRYTDAWHRLAAADVDRQEASAVGVRLHIARVAVSIGRGLVAEGVARSAAARDDAARGADAELLAEALEACACAQLAAGDHAQAEAAAVRGLAHAKAVHHPMLALRLRLLRAEAARRMGHRAPAAVLVARCSRLRADSLPPVLRVRLDLLRDLLAGVDADVATARRGDAAALPGLAMFAPPRANHNTAPPAADEIVGLLQCCQSAQDDRAVLMAVCLRLRARLGAASVAFFGQEEEQLVLVASDGPRPDTALAERIRTAGQIVMPHDGGTRPDAGTVVRYAAQTLGVLVCTWTPAARVPVSDVAMLLSTAAAAASPALAGAMTSRASARHAKESELIGVSGAAGEIRAAIERAASAPFPVLVLGESGSGKELVARLLHKRGARRDRPFCTLNCAAMPDDLVESELFGHARGAFTGAAAERRGVFEEAHGGTLFLDEVGELSPRAQAKLLRAIQEGEIRRVGENTCRRVDVRLVAATNRDLRAEAVAGRFRIDLVYRLDVVRIVVSPLRARRDDIPVLVEHLWHDAASRVGSRAILAPSTIAALARHDWPGNIRELQNVLSSLAVRCPKRGVVLPTALPAVFDGARPEPSHRLNEARDAFDRAFIRAALERCGGQRTRAARELGLSRQGLAKLMARLELGGLDAPGEAELAMSR
ncbi:MAG: sigma-54 dependent transcriptional regulator [Vicinamibacterales bacterium]